jgi:hypothetical protein
MSAQSSLHKRSQKPVHVRFAEDQMEIPASLLDEFEKFIVPGSGRVIEVVR